jgi:hypothetical protein
MAELIAGRAGLHQPGGDRHGLNARSDGRTPAPPTRNHRSNGAIVRTRPRLPALPDHTIPETYVQSPLIDG